MSAAKELKATARPRAGKGAARAARREGLVPAVIYGGNQPPLTIALPFKDVNQRIYAGHFLSTVFEIDVDGTKIRAIPRDYQLDVVRDTPLHVDFLRVVAGSTIRVDIPVHVRGQDQSPGVKAGGVVNLIHHTIEVTCPPDAIPDGIDVDITGTNIGDTIHVSQITMPAGVKPTDKSDFTVVSIATPSKLDTTPAAAAAAEEPKA